MKKLFTLFVTLLVLKNSFATVDTIKVSNNQFTPATLNAVVGDTIYWQRLEGFHTTSSTSVNGGIPAGAAAWDAPLQTESTAFFKYVVKVTGTYNYECRIHTPFMEGVINVNGALPVVLNKFGVTSGKINAALLAWSTASEINTDHFEIMRSTNGNNFYRIASVVAKGNSSALVNYSYIDNIQQVGSRYIYYFLNIIDKDGKKSSSGIIKFQNTKGSSKLIVSLSPNPIGRTGHLMLQFNADEAGLMHAQLFDLSGKLVMKEDLTAVAGLNNGHFHVGGITPGTYTIVFTMGSQKESYKVIVE